MTKLQMNEIQKEFRKFKDIEEVKKEIKSVQSIKCRLKKQKAKKTYDQEMTEIVKKEQILKEVRQMFEPKKLTVTTMTKNDIASLDYDDTIKAIKSIQSKKCNTQFLTADPETNVEYQQALKIEKMLLDHKNMLKETSNLTKIKKSSINDLVSQIENLDENVSKEYLLDQLKKLL